MTTTAFLAKAPQTEAIQKTIMTMAQKLDFDGTCLVSISGGSDSDILLDLIENSEKTCKIVYVFFDTGIEYQATHDHLKYLENKYGVTIERLKPKCPIPTAIKQYGVPLFSKQESEYLGRLQRHGFDFLSHETYETDYVKHPKAKSALCYWHNNWGEGSSFNIERRKGLKEFIQSNSPDFNISNKCCQKAKKDVAHMAETIFKPDLKIVGVRKDEGGARAYAYKNCFTPSNKDGIAEYRPLFFWTDVDKYEYDLAFNVQHSRCYTEYGLKRTGCAGCPFSSHFEEELQIIKGHEPKLYKAVCAIFGKGYDYFRAYRAFRQTLG